MWPVNNKIVPERGHDTVGLVKYLFGPGRFNEHTDQRVIAASDTFGIADGKRLSDPGEIPPAIGRHPPRPHLTRAEHGNPGRVPAAWGRAGRPTVRAAEFSVGNKMPKKRMLVTPTPISRTTARPLGSSPPS